MYTILLVSCIYEKKSANLFFFVWSEVNSFCINSKELETFFYYVRMNRWCLYKTSKKKQNQLNIIDYPSFSYKIKKTKNKTKQNNQL